MPGNPPSAQKLGRLHRNYSTWLVCQISPMGHRLTRREPEIGDAEVASSVRAFLNRIETEAIRDFVRRRPLAQVQDFADEFLGGLTLEAKGATGLSYMRVHGHLFRARRKEGIPSPRKHSVARERK